MWARGSAVGWSQRALIVDRSGAKLVLIGDGGQLPSIGAGGMFDQLADIAPTAELSNVRRMLDRREQRARAPGERGGRSSLRGRA
jgi:ATP-dependent exoDNAse (exonuclease V) alpha subunit